MAESGSWPSIQKHGLLSTSALLDLFEVKGKERFTIESQWRPDKVTISHPIYGSAMIRDQKPLRESTLKQFLEDMSPREYYELLNRKTFFWVRVERLKSLLGARAYKDRSHSVLVVDTRMLLDDYKDDAWLSPINSGAIFGSGKRGSKTFTRINQYPFEAIEKKKHDDAIVEVAIDYAVNDISKYAVRVEEWKGNGVLEIIWKGS